MGVTDGAQHCGAHLGQGAPPLRIDGCLPPLVLMTRDDKACSLNADSNAGPVIEFLAALYGTTSCGGGANNDGTVFALTP